MEDAVSRMRVQDFDISFTHLNKASMAMTFFILKIYLGVTFSWLDLETLDVLDQKVDPDDFSYKWIG